MMLSDLELKDFEGEELINYLLNFCKVLPFLTTLKHCVRYVKSNDQFRLNLFRKDRINKLNSEKFHEF